MRSEVEEGYGMFYRCDDIVGEKLVTAAPTMSAAFFTPPQLALCTDIHKLNRHTPQSSY